MTTVSAEAKLIPKPPALVDKRKQKSYKTKKNNRNDYVSNWKLTNAAIWALLYNL